MHRHFHASRLKRSRALQHFEELKAAADAYTKREPVVLVFERIVPAERFAKYHPVGTQFVGLVARIRETVPEALAPIAGDVVHNLRSALDIMMCDLVGAANPAIKIDDIKFPFCKNERDFEGVAKRSIAQAGQAIVDLTKAWQPFQGGRAGLYELHRLDIIDKHRSIIPTMTGAEFSLPIALMDECPDDQQIFDPSPERFKVWDGKLLASGPTECSPPIGTERRCSTRLALDDEYMCGYDLLETLHRQLEIVEAVLESFETGMPPTFVNAPAPVPAQVPFNTWLAVRGGGR